MKPIKRKNRFLDRPVGWPDFLGEPQGGQRLPRHHLRRQLGERHADGLGDKGHGARCPGVDLEHIDRVALHGVLHVHQSDHLEFPGHRVGVIPDHSDHFLGKRVRRQDHGGVARMHTGEFNVLQHAAHDRGALGGVLELPHIGNTVDIHLRCVLEEFVHQHGAFGGSLHGKPHVLRELHV